MGIPFVFSVTAKELEITSKFRRLASDMARQESDL